MKDLKLVQKSNNNRLVQVGNVTFGGKEIVLIGGPCAVESPEQVSDAAKTAKKAGAKILRGGIFKPRTSPYSFQGLGEKGINYLVDAAQEQGLLSVTEVIDSYSLELVFNKVDVVQIGARNMQNFQLLKLVGESKKPVILKRGIAATVEEWLLAAEYILAAGNPNVILCERGIRTYETSTRNTLDLSAIGVAKALTYLPVIVDPSHAAGRIDIIPGLSKAAIAAGADGLIIEMHPNPEKALSDGAQSLNPGQFMQLAAELVPVANSVGRTFMNYRGAQESLDDIRIVIDGIDNRIVELIAERMKVVEKIAGQKSLEQIKDKRRESEVNTRLHNLAVDLECPPDLVKRIYTSIFDFAVQKQIQIKSNKQNLTQEAN